MTRGSAISCSVAACALLLTVPLEAQSPGRPRVVRAAKATTSAPLAQLAALAPRAPAAGPGREINPLGMPPVPAARLWSEGWVDIVREDAVSLAPAPAPYLSFEGIDNRDGVAPPDTNGDVGKDHYVQWVNLSLSVFDKRTGTTLLGPVNGRTLWTGFGGICETNDNGDPIVLYDPLADRWLFSQFGLGTDGHQCIAVSATASPMGPYHLYDFVITPGGTNDYPKFGVWPDAYLYMANEFTPGFTAAVIGGFDRAKLLAGDPAATAILFTLAPGLSGFTHFATEPANLEGSTPPPADRPGLFVQPIDSALWGGASDRYNIWKVDFDFAVPASSTATLTQLSAGVPAFNAVVCFAVNACVPQPSTARRLDLLSQFTMYRPVYRNFGSHEVLLVNHTVNAGAGVAGIRWTEIRDPFGTAAVHQTGTHSPSSSHRWMGSIAMDGDGNILLGYSVSSASTFPSIAYAGRLATDPLGTLPVSESFLISGSGSQTGSSRWGDYASMSVDETGDPSFGVPPDCGFWFTSEYVQTSGSQPWRTRIGAVNLPGCGASAAPQVALAVNGEHPPSDVVTSSGPVRVTLDMIAGGSTDPMGWFYGIVIGGSLFWVTSTGLSTTPAPILTAPPQNLDDVAIFDFVLPSGTQISFVFALVDGAAVVASDVITAVVN
jgi:hypothetical protein